MNHLITLKNVNDDIGDTDQLFFDDGDDDDDDEKCSLTTNSMVRNGRNGKGLSRINGVGLDGILRKVKKMGIF